MSAPLELIYFPLRARTESIWYALRYAKIPCTDRAVALADWPQVKPTLPPGKTGERQVPVLRCADGTLMPETADIGKYIAQLSSTTPGARSILPSDPAAAKAAQELYEETQQKPLVMGNFLFSWLEKEEAPAKIAEWVPVVKAWLTETAIKHGIADGKQPFFAGATPGLGDFGVAHVIDNLLSLHPSALTELPRGLVEWARRVRQLPGVKEYLAERPRGGSGKVGRPGSLHGDDASIDARLDATW
eukprot:TRINITY_DN169_c0_g1_i1.p1 TRINITY_DN169_c0_g1~~TRINITY_DN169_c0_g1_i1.p1  ORF type:complete len:245 (-),score=46.69 TRINITY_DN169_c0_g1_i1:588-1322(-)